MTRPAYPRYLDPNWPYIRAEDTDIRKTFERAREELAAEEARRGAAIARLGSMIPTQRPCGFVLFAPSILGRRPR